MSALSKVKWCLVGGLITVFLFGTAGWLVPAELTSALDWLSHIPGSDRAKVIPFHSEVAQDRMVEMSLESVSMSRGDMQPVVLLREKGGQRYLPVSIGMAEARAIAIVLQSATPSRPLTHDLLRAAIESLGAHVQSIFIEDLRDGVFYANVMVTVKGKRIELGSRPSDAMALALRTGTPIYASEKLLYIEPSPGDIKAKADM